MRRMGHLGRRRRRIGRGSGGDGRTSILEVAFWNKLARFGMMRSRRGRFIPLLCVTSDSNPRRRYPQKPFKESNFRSARVGANRKRSAELFGKTFRHRQAVTKVSKFVAKMIKIANDLDSSQLLDIFVLHFPKICTCIRLNNCDSSRKFRAFRNSRNSSANSGDRLCPAFRYVTIFSSAARRQSGLHASVRE